MNQAAAGCSGATRHKHHAILERRVPFDVTVAYRPFVVEREQDESADVVEERPTLGADRFGEGREPAANPIRRENLRRGEHRENLGVDRVDLRHARTAPGGSASRGSRRP